MTDVKRKIKIAFVKRGIKLRKAFLYGDIDLTDNEWKTFYRNHYE